MDFKVRSGSLVDTVISGENLKEAAKKLKKLRENTVVLAEESDLVQVV